MSRSGRMSVSNDVLDCQKKHHNHHKETTMTTTETTTKPRWVECADEAAKVLGAARNVSESIAKDATVREADAWMRLGYLYRDGHLNAPESHA